MNLSQRAISATKRQQTRNVSIAHNVYSLWLRAAASPRHFILPHDDGHVGDAFESFVQSERSVGEPTKRHALVQAETSQTSRTYKFQALTWIRGSRANSTYLTSVNRAHLILWCHHISLAPCHCNPDSHSLECAHAVTQAFPRPVDKGQDVVIDAKAGRCWGPSVYPSVGAIVDAGPGKHTLLAFYTWQTNLNCILSSPHTDGAQFIPSIGMYA